MSVPPVRAEPIEEAIVDESGAVPELETRQQGIRYLIVGGWNTLFGYCSFAALQIAFGKHVYYLFLLSIAMVFAILNAYIGYRLFVFKVRGRWIRDLGRFSVVYLGSFAANLAILPLLVEVAGIPVLVAQAFTVAGTVAMSFFAHRSFSFRRPRGADAGDEQADG
jgi:putative flippase GtrA